MGTTYGTEQKLRVSHFWEDRLLYILGGFGHF